MTHTQFADAMTAIGWRDAELCRRLGCDGNLTTRWRRGTSPVPPDVAAWVRDLAWAVQNIPAPVDWRRSGGKKG